VSLASELRVQDRPGGVRVLTLANEAKRNAVDPALLRAITAACAQADADAVRCLVLTGAGDRAFCAGYDLDALEAADPSQALPDAVLQEAALALERAKAPVIAAVNGACYGAGGELAAACDLRLGAPGAVLSMPPARLGIVYAPSGLQRFVELVGLAHARRIFYTGDPVNARHAQEIGFLDEIAEDVLAAAVELAERIAAGSPQAVQGMKRIFALMRRRDLPPGVAAEVEALRRASFASADAREGLAAVREKRRPRFE
jgi:enoyl-CoA hydratase/carnithine racemase